MCERFCTPPAHDMQAALKSKKTWSKMVCHAKGKPKGGDVINVKKK